MTEKTTSRDDFSFWIFRRKENVRARLAAGLINQAEAAELFDYLFMQALGEIGRLADQAASAGCVVGDIQISSPLADLIVGEPLFKVDKLSAGGGGVWWRRKC